MSETQIKAKLEGMTQEEVMELDRLTAVQEVQQASKDLFFYLENFVYTQDEHDMVQPIKRLPMHKQYLRELAQYFLDEPLLLIEKSRQMMVTWLMIACNLWDAQFHLGRRIFFQSKKENDANHLVDRAKMIYDNYPPHYKAVIEQLYPMREPRAYLRMEFGKSQSIIQGTPQGADVIRQYTASRVFSDEMAFQEKAEEAYIAAKPTIVGGGKFVGVSTPNFKNFFYLLAKDLV
jgi:phage FluMu gp28-like protein